MRLFRSRCSREWEVTYEYTDCDGKRITESRMVEGDNYEDLERELDSIRDEFKDPAWGYKMLYYNEYYGEDY